METVTPEQKISWLLHSQNEPVENGNIFRFDEEQGRLFCKTFLPENYKRTKIGGPGKEFWVDGKNYPMGKTRMAEYAKRFKGKKAPLFGNWRMEITPGKPGTEVRYLNLIQVGFKKDTPAMVKSQYVKEGSFEGVSFTSRDNTTYTVLFDHTGLKGKIRAVKNGKILFDRPLTNKIQKQKAFQK